jgi:hypothetical protein
MIIKPLIKVSVDPATREERLKALLEGGVLSSVSADDAGRLRVQSDGVFFDGLLVAGVRYDLLLQKDLLESGSVGQESHWDYVTAQSGVVVPNGQVLYAMDHLAYCLRDDARAKTLVQEFRGFHVPDWEKRLVHTGTRVDYELDCEEATIQHLGLDGKVCGVNVKIPEFERHDEDWSYLILADEQPASKLGTVRSIPPTAKSFLSTLLGPSYREAGAVYQFMSSRKGENLREVRVWVPTLANRASPRALVLGVYDGNGRFDIDASGIYDSGPARGVVVRKKSST